MPERKMNKMGVMPVKRLVISMSLPMMISMLVQAMYNVVDSIFVGMISEQALTAVTAAFPLQMLMISVTSGTGVGVNALLSRSLGSRDFDRADEAANTAILLAFLNFVVFLVIGLLFSRAFIGTITKSEIVHEYGTSYLSIVMCVGVGIHFQLMLERLLQSTGLTIYSMISQATGAIINIIFDPIFIFGLLGFPKMGVAGAAYATVMGQIIAALLALVFNLKKNKELHFSWKKIFSPTRENLREIYYVGFPSILMMSIGSVMNYLMNLILKGFSETAIAVFGVYFKMQSFFFMPVFGLNNGLIPIIAFNYGAGKRKRIIETLRFALVLAISIMLVGVAVFELFPGKLLDMFSASEQMKAIGIPALRTIALCFPVAAICIVLGSCFQAFAKGFYSLIVSIARQLVVLIPVAWLLSRLGNVAYVWWAFPIAEVVSLITSLLLYRRLKTTVIEKIPEE